MTLYELTKKYGNGKGEEMMWTTLAAVSDAIENSMPTDEKWKLMRELYGKMSGYHYDEGYAREDVSKMYYIDRTKEQHDAPYWTDDQVFALYEGLKSRIPAYNKWDFYVALNMSAADNWCMLKEWFPTASVETMNEKLADMAVNFLDDPDSPYGDGKIWKYLHPEK